LYSSWSSFTSHPLYPSIFHYLLYCYSFVIFSPKHILQQFLQLIRVLFVDMNAESNGCLLLAKILVQLFESFDTEGVLSFQQLQQWNAQSPYIKSFANYRLLLVDTNDQLWSCIPLCSNKLVSYFEFFRLQFLSWTIDTCEMLKSMILMFPS